MRVEADVLEYNKQYEARGIVCGVQPVGHYEEDPLVRKPIFRYLTLDCGQGHPSIAVKFVRQAEFIEVQGQKELDMTKLKEGDIVVSPGFIYRKVPWSSALMTRHLAALKKYRRKDIIKAERDDAPAITLPDIDLKGLTKQ